MTATFAPTVMSADGAPRLNNAYPETLETLFGILFTLLINLFLFFY